MPHSYEETVQAYRHNIGRKCSSFEEAEDDTHVTISADDAAVLGIYDADRMGITDPSADDLPRVLTDRMVFILKRGAKHYLINTEGYYYCRYTALCTIVVQEGTRPDKWIADAVLDNLESDAGEELVSVALLSDDPV